MILPLTEKDFYLLACAKDCGYTDEWEQTVLSSSLKSGNFYGFKAEIENEFSGYVHYSTSIDAMDINSVFVFPNFRKKGIAEKLLNAVIGDAKERKIDKIFLEVRESNTPAIKLYEKLGFKIISERKKYYKNGETAKIMLKEILL